MGWRDYKLPTPIDNIDKIDKTLLPELSNIGFVDNVGFVHRVSPTEKVGAFPYQQGIPEAQEYALTEIMGEMVQTICDRIVEEHKRIGKASYVSTSETQWSEDEITRIYHNVLRGEAKLSDYEKACNKWLAGVMANLNK